MTPLLVLVVKVQPLAAVSSDLVAAVIMKPVDGLVVAMTSVGSGSLMIVLLLLLSPTLRASGLKLLGVGNLQLGLLVLALVLLAVPVWGALDATLHPEPAWAGAPVGRRLAVGVQLVGAPLGRGAVAALACFGLL